MSGLARPKRGTTMLVKFNSDWPPLYKRGAVLELPDRIAVHFVDRCIASAVRPGEARAAPGAGRADAAAPRESSHELHDQLYHRHEDRRNPLHYSAPVPLRLK
jgi:hypothetical protein